MDGSSNQTVSEAQRKRPGTADAAALTFMSQCCDAIRQNAQQQPVRAGVASLERALADACRSDYTPSSLPILESASTLNHGLLIDEFKALYSTLPWKPSFRSDDNGQQIALASFNEMFDLGDVTCGLMYVGAGFRYPEHQHEPQELYLVLTGGARWRHGGNDDYCELDSAAVIYNKPWDWHGVKAGRTPLLSLFVLWPEPLDV